MPNLLDSAAYLHAALLWNQNFSPDGSLVRAAAAIAAGMSALELGSDLSRGPRSNTPPGMFI
ncbi:MAG: hypothetical protein ACRECP_04870 [Methylocella sp.]